MEKIARYSGWIAWDELGRIVAYDDNLHVLLGYLPSQSLILKPVTVVFNGGELMEGMGITRYCPHTTLLFLIS